MDTSHLPPDHADRMARARLALDGLSVGDAFGSQFFLQGNAPLLFGPRRADPPGPWRYTDDTEMALGILEVLARHGTIDQDDLALTFARRYALEMYRGYGAGAHGILSAIGSGTPWREAAGGAFGGQGSCGNGSAMRVGPVAGYFADDPDRAAREARLSAEVTHLHPEGVAGGIAAAVAGVIAWQLRDRADDPAARAEFFDAVLAAVPPGETRRGIEHAALLDSELSIETASTLLGNGVRITAMDTVPFALWVSARHLANYPDAIWATAHAGGDIDTNCAIVGGIVAMSARVGIPEEWLTERETLK